MYQKIEELLLETKPYWFFAKKKRDEEKRKYIEDCKLRGKETKKIAQLGRELMKDLSAKIHEGSDKSSTDFDYMFIQSAFFKDFHKAASKYIFMAPKEYISIFPLLDFSKSRELLKKDLLEIIISDLKKSYMDEKEECQSSMIGVKKGVFIIKYDKDYVRKIDDKLKLIRIYAKAS